MDYETILNEAIAAAQVAVAGKTDTQAFNCGFAWVTIDGKSPLANHCRKKIKQVGGDRRADRKYGSKGYPSGWQFWDPANYYGQDMDVKVLGARAFQQVLADYNIVGTVGSRLD